VGLAHLLGEPLNFRDFIAEDDCLSDCQGLIQVAECLKLILFLFDCDKELLNLIKSQLVTLDQNLHRVIHELVGHLKDLLGKGG